MRYGIIGTGAIGGFYGAKLAHAGQELHFLLHSDYEYVKQHGLQVDSCDGSFHLDDVNAYPNTEDMPKCDVVLVCLKSGTTACCSRCCPRCSTTKRWWCSSRTALEWRRMYRRCSPTCNWLPDWPLSVRRRRSPALSTTNVMEAGVELEINRRQDEAKTKPRRR